MEKCFFFGATFLAISCECCSLFNMRWIIKSIISCFQTHKPALCASVNSRNDTFHLHDVIFLPTGCLQRLYVDICVPPIFATIRYGKPQYMLVHMWNMSFKWTLK